MTPFESLIAEFAKNTGLPLEADAQESCSLETEDLVITLQYRRERDDVVLFAPVSEPPRRSARPSNSPATARARAATTSASSRARSCSRDSYRSTA